MTIPAPTVTQEIETALRHLDTADNEIQHTSTTAFVAIGDARTALERALKQIQHARCEATSALDWL